MTQTQTASAEEALAAAPRPDPPQRKTLEFVKPASSPTVNIFLYGPPKTGKTMAAASAPKPLLYLNADKPNATYLAHQEHEFDEARITCLADLVAAIDYLEANPTKYKTVVLDPLSHVYTALLEDVSGHAMRPMIQQYGDVNTHLIRFCRNLMDRELHVVFIAHEITVEDDDHLEKLAFTGTKNPALGLSLMSEVDVIGYTGIVEKEGGDRDYMATLVNARGRRGGSRFPLGASRKLDLSEWIEAISAPTDNE